MCGHCLLPFPDFCFASVHCSRSWSQICCHKLAESCHKLWTGPLGQLIPHRSEAWLFLRPSDGSSPPNAKSFLVSTLKSQVFAPSLKSESHASGPNYFIPANQLSGKGRHFWVLAHHHPADWQQSKKSANTHTHTYTHGDGNENGFKFQVESQVPGSSLKSSSSLWLMGLQCDLGLSHGTRVYIPAEAWPVPSKTSCVAKIHRWGFSHRWTSMLGKKNITGWILPSMAT